MRQVKCERKDHEFLPEHWHIEYDEGEIEQEGLPAGEVVLSENPPEM